MFLFTHRHLSRAAHANGSKVVTRFVFVRLQCMLNMSSMLNNNCVAADEVVNTVNESCREIVVSLDTVY